MSISYLEYDDIVLINQMSIEQHGGNFVPPHNFLKEEGLLYTLESVGAEMFGAPLYPSIPDEAAIYMFNIISNHVFQDGNKRTGLEAALLFLKLNGHRLVSGETEADISPDELYHFTMAVAAGEHNLDAVRDWFAVHAKEK
ncbi:type II toxin-antitoxin system death-on-curing family toxin [Neolewinella lacunae]|uniref:Type II toxin-antitoxin system death-on-curing family toxin n=1 Tax=Neolewinella lacunae TaxID=1517758 RepID=A0A923PHB7_9BACT|nr:type II toxin-antitoxin system death-on-curing family toxin [Neolewinella lacunae]MBC6992721.1 type II toxin-antitoxin system death-on-curing family toxin [Neolewinella lacunae]MDN3635965.1 type II toxin-antitoxin system death-on-curing family toxin [Neolewinella lacunae]